MISPKLAFNFDNYFPTFNGSKILGADFTKIKNAGITKSFLN
jgi:hypothetical protein